MVQIVWFRQDLRMADNPALWHAAERGAVLPLFILDESRGSRPLGGASRWWLHHSLSALSRALGGLVLRRGDPRQILPELVKKVGAKAVLWNRCYEPHAVARDMALKADLAALGLDVSSFNGALLFEPWQVKTGDGGPFKVYSPFWRACLKMHVERPLGLPTVRLASLAGLGERLDDWALLPRRPDWSRGFSWQPGETGASASLERFLDHGLSGYAKLRDRPDLPNVSRLSPHLHFGEVSPRQIWSAAHTRPPDRDTEKFLSEIGWREFSYHLLFHFPHLADRNWRTAFDAFPWRQNHDDLKAWQTGMTGYPVVDAGMRELWATGYMHNRVRMITASFLVKHLRIHWRDGESWFWDTLVDADLANNSAGWQWVAGSGADAAPYFRIFNPITQGRNFDPDGAYVRRWCPEIARLPDPYIHAPFEAPADVLATAGVVLGGNYPRPIVDHGEARQAALAGYEAVKAAGASA